MKDRMTAWMKKKSIFLSIACSPKATTTTTFCLMTSKIYYPIDKCPRKTEKSFPFIWQLTHFLEHTFECHKQSFVKFIITIVFILHSFVCLCLNGKWWNLYLILIRLLFDWIFYYVKICKFRFVSISHFINSSKSIQLTFFPLPIP
jgi:hypothetical protein